MIFQTGNIILTISEIFFWGGILLILHSYVLFPLILKIFSGKKAENKIWYDQEGELPEVDILLAVHNEESVIKEKIFTVFNSNYPKSKIRFYIGSDASADLTDELISEMQKSFPELNFFPFAERSGKPKIMNFLAGKAKGEILILTDANVMFEKDTIYQLVKHFRNQEIGLVGANILNPVMTNDQVTIQERSYLYRENLIKHREGLIWGTMMGAFGGCFALRRNEFRNIPENFIVDDFYITMNVLKNKKKSILELNATCNEDLTGKLYGEFRRKTRISAGNFQNLSHFKNLIFSSMPGLSFCFISHKILRWFTPFLLIFSLLLSLYLGTSNRIYFVLFVLQVFLLVLPLLDFVFEKLRINLKLLRFITHFYGMNLALIIGFYRFLKGVETNIWAPTKRNKPLSSIQ